mmetsp:Transcript_14149/g.40321  ORF Transcript_14149/g.40321 Transcript_14149/m.40321 type:complete len:205 (+) Transcript_14149:192-806(+)
MHRILFLSNSSLVPCCRLRHPPRRRRLHHHIRHRRRHPCVHSLPDFPWNSRPALAFQIRPRTSYPICRPAADRRPVCLPKQTDDDCIHPSMICPLFRTQQRAHPRSPNSDPGCCQKTTTRQNRTSCGHPFLRFASSFHRHRHNSRCRQDSERCAADNTGSAFGIPSRVASSARSDGTTCPFRIWRLARCHPTRAYRLECSRPQR